MAHYDVFNGDADGICSLIQLRLAKPLFSQLITGIKRDIQLLEKTPAQAGDQVTVLDISFEKNSEAANRLLQNGVSIFYADHHRHGPLPDHPNLEAHIDTSAEICTALIIDRLLKGQYRAWALTAAYGDNLASTASALGEQSGFSSEELQQLQQLGTCINYNGYGASLEDLHIHPAELYQQLCPYETPFAFIEDQPGFFHGLQQSYLEDMAQARATRYHSQSESTASLILPNEPWARRVSGVLSNELANRFPDRAHAVLTERPNGSYLVSVRAPLNNRQGADQLVSQFPTGGGRQAAAGINELPQSMLGQFIDQLEQHYGHR